MSYVPHTQQDVSQMLERIGIASVDQLFDEVPKGLLTDDFAGFPSAQSEMRVQQQMLQRADQDAGHACFIGAGAYEHYIPAAVWDVTSRGEYMTAYTPYQAEASQGTLQLIYEYQTMMTRLTAMEVANASLYDGATALAESLLMAVRVNRKSKSRAIILPKVIHPLYRAVCRTIVSVQSIELIELPVGASGKIEQDQLAQFSAGEIAAIVIPQPNFFGALEAVDELTDWAHQHQAIAIGLVNPTALALVKPPGLWGQAGADIVVGEGQPLGVPLSSGGPYFGFMACKQKYVRQMPGRIIGRTTDQQGRKGFTLTLQAREQHIRRSKATSNICTNQGLAVTAATIYLSLMGSQGLQQVAQSSHQGACYLKHRLADQGFTAVLDTPCFHEWLYQTPLPAATVIDEMAQHQLQAGVALDQFYQPSDFVAGSPIAEVLSRAILVCVTETKTRAELNQYSDRLQELCHG